MARRIHEMLGGARLALPRLRADIATMVAHLHAAAVDVNMDDAHFEHLVAFARSHPDLPAALQPVLTDLLARRAVLATPPDMLNVEQTAERLGVHPSWIRRAAASGQLTGRKQGRRWAFSPADVHAFNVARGPRRGPRAGQACPLHVTVVAATGGGLQLKAPDIEQFEAEGSSVVRLRVVTWSCAAILFGQTGAERMFVLVPGGLGDELRCWGESIVRGRFIIERKYNNSQEASMAWSAFEPE